MVGAVLLAVGFGRPPQAVTTQTVPVSHAGRFDYTAPVRAGTFYGAPIITTGQPVFTALAPRITVTFTDRVPAGLRGTAELTAAVGDGTGWQRSVPIAGPVDVSGPLARVSGTLDLAAVRALTRQYEAQTNHTAGSYVLTLRATVRLTGRVDGARVSSTFAPTLGLRLEPLALTGPSSPNQVGPANVKPPADPFAVTMTDQPRASRLAAARVSAFGLATLPVSGVRTAGLVAVLVAAGLAAAAAALYRGRRRDDQLTAIRRRYGDLLVPGVAPSSTPTTVQVATIEDLATLARRYESAIVHATGEARHTFSVYDGAVTYRYELALAAAGPGAALNGHGPQHLAP